MRRVRQKWQLKKQVTRRKQKVKRTKMSSASEEAFLDAVEAMFGVKVFRQFPLEYWFYDAQYGKVLFELDGFRWHSRPRQKRRDAKKDETAKRFGFTLHRIRLDRVRDIPRVLEENKQLLNEIFNGKELLISSSG
jgi:very-short-patch-repair endonuclease